MVFSFDSAMMGKKSVACLEIVRILSGTFKRQSCFVFLKIGPFSKI